MKRILYLLFMLFSLTMCEKDENKTYCWECVQTILSTTIKCGYVVSNDSTRNVIMPCNITAAEARTLEESLTEFTEEKSGSSTNVPCNSVRKQSKKTGKCTRLM